MERQAAATRPCPLERLISIAFPSRSSAVADANRGPFHAPPRQVPFDAKAAKGRSVWFNPSLVQSDPGLKEKVDLITRTLANEEESALAYTKGVPADPLAAP